MGDYLSQFAELFAAYDVLGAFWVNIQLTFWAAIFSLVLGTVLALMRISPIVSLQWAGAAYVNVLRNTPLTIIMTMMVLGIWTQLQISLADDFATNFSTWVVDQQTELNHRLVEIYGLPSPDDWLDNDLDGVTGNGDNLADPIDGVEAGLDPFFEGTPGTPDLVNFLVSNEQLAVLGWAPRSAPGQVQIAMAEARIARLQVDLARQELDALAAEIADRTQLLIEQRMACQVHEPRPSLQLQAGHAEAERRKAHRGRQPQRRRAVREHGHQGECEPERGRRVHCHRRGSE